jgi:ligand-binding sensor domain-containing protein
MSSIPLVKFINCQPYTNMVIMRTSNTGMTLASLNLAMWNFYVVQVANAHAMNRYRRMEL